MRMRLMTKTLLGFLVVLLLLGVIAVVSTISLGSVIAKYEALISRVDEAMIQAQYLEANVLEEAGAVYGYLLTREAKYKQDFEEAKKRADKTLAVLQELIRSDQGKAILFRVEQAKENYAAVARPVFNRAEFSAEEITALTGQTLRNSLQALQQAVDELLEYEETLVIELRKEAENVASQGRFIILVTGVVAVVIGIGFAVVLSRSITNPMVSISRQLGEMAAAGGDLTRELVIRSSDEVGDLCKNLNLFLGTLRELIRGVGTSSQAVAASVDRLNATTQQVAQASQGIAEAMGQVAQGASSQLDEVTKASRVVEQLRSAISEIAAGAQEQSKSAQYMSCIVEQMVASVETVAQDAHRMANSSQEATKAAKDGSEVVDRTVEGMGRIRQAVLESATRLKELGRFSEQIGEITQVIADIADQTNLLALNAAIEAARAGEHGKGFAVVADEVRKLAERAGKSAKEIASLIRSIQEGTAQAVRAMEQGTIEVEAGSKQAAEAGQALSAILTVVEQVTRGIHAIAATAQQVAASSREVAKSVASVAAVTEENTAAIEEMAAGSDQVTTSIEQIAAISQQNAAAADEVSASVEEMNASMEEIAASAESLAEIAQQLQDRVGRFKV
ncbi:MAG: methyl-accepting chemotaxis protein [Bacillota bacterium]